MIKSALCEVHKHSDAQKFKREHPEEAYKNVKSKIAGNHKSIGKAQKRAKCEHEESLSPSKSSPMKTAMSFIYSNKSERDINSPWPAGSPGKKSAGGKSPLKGNAESLARINKIQELIDAQEKETANLRRELDIAREIALSERSKKADSPIKSF